MSNKNSSGFRMISIKNLYSRIGWLQENGATSISVCISETTLRFWCHEDPLNCSLNPKGDHLGFIKDFPVIRTDSKVGLIKCVLGGGIHFEHVYEEHQGTNKTMR